MRIAIPALLLALLTACGDTGSSGHDAAVDGGVDGTLVDADPMDASCFMNPQTHVEIINACTTAQAIDKHPVLPLLLPDGGLPPLP